MKANYFRLTGGLLALLATGPHPTVAQEIWPAKAVTVVVPFAAGGNVDVAARLFSERLSTRLGKQFVIENKTGAGGSTGIAHMTKQAPDGYTLGVASAGTLYILPHIYKQKLGFDTFKDIKVLTMVAYQPNVLAIHPSLPAKTVREFITLIKANPDKYSYGSSGIGSSQHLCMELIVQATGAKLAHVPYRASNQIMQDLISGQIQMTCDQYSTVNEQAKAGKVAMLAVSSASRYPAVPDVPTLAETMPGIDVTWAAAFIAPAGLPKPIADKLTAELISISKEPAMIKRLEDLGVTPLNVSGDALDAQIKADYAKWQPIVESAKIPVP
jgi:tripartite-type tricarboxylate transporter receptor subunit TctC